jgi:inhibitor of KinA
MKIEPLGDSAAVATLGTRIDAATLASVLKFSGAVASARGRGIVDIVPAYATVTVFYDPAQFAGPGEDAYEEVRRFMESCAMRGGGGAPAAARKPVEIPVCYGGDLGPDLGFVAEHAAIGAPEVVARHSAAEYVVHAIGFTPGFPFLGGLPDSLRTPRRDTPRAVVPAGSVGIGGFQTGVYPIASPGGWQIIGRTPLGLFQPDRTPASLLRPGDRVRFREISAGEFESWR